MPIYTKGDDKSDPNNCTKQLRQVIFKTTRVALQFEFCLTHNMGLENKEVQSMCFYHNNRITIYVIFVDLYSSI